MTDAQKFIFEDILLYSVVLTGDLTWDFFQNIFHAAGLIMQPVPYLFGVYQVAVAVFCAVQLSRKINHWRYYR